MAVKMEMVAAAVVVTAGMKARSAHLDLQT